MNRGAFSLTHPTNIMPSPIPPHPPHLMGLPCSMMCMSGVSRVLSGCHITT